MPSIRHIASAKNPPPVIDVGVILNYCQFDDIGPIPRAMLSLNKAPVFEHHLAGIGQQLHTNTFGVAAICGNTQNKIMDKIPNHVMKIENEKYTSLGDARSVGLGLRVLNYNKILVLDTDSRITMDMSGINTQKSYVVLSNTHHSNICGNYDHRTQELEMLM